MHGYLQLYRHQLMGEDLNLLVLTRSSGYIFWMSNQGCAAVVEQEQEQELYWPPNKNTFQVRCNHFGKIK